MESRQIRLVLQWVSVWAVVLTLLPALGRAAAISSLKANTDTVGRYEKYELTFDLTGVTPSDFNPFRPETTGDSLSPAGVDVWAEVMTPSGAVQKVWGFYDVDFAYLGNFSNPDHAKYERIVPVSDPHWHVRYAPAEVGSHRVTVKVTDRAGTSSSQQLAFACVESAHRGFVKVSEDGTRFVYSDGSPFVPFGTMMPYGTEKIAPTTAAMKANGMNFVRKWLVNRDKDDIHRDLEGWSSYTADTTVRRSGERSAVETVTGTGSVVDKSFIGCKPNTYYRAFAYLKTSSAFDGQVAVYVVEDRADRTKVVRTGNKIGGGRDWAYSEVVFKTGDNAEMLHFKPRVLSGSTGTVWVDDVGLYECDSAGRATLDYNMVFNPSFEVWTPAQLRLIPLARFEHLLQMCEANDIVVEPVFFDYRLWNKISPTGFYSRFFGDWWSDPASIAQQERALRYVIARFAHYRSLFAWELTNEMDASYTDVRGAWIAGRANFIRAGDPYDHPITNSYWSSPADYEYGQMRELDFNQVHYYINTEERAGGQGYPTWWNISSGMAIDSNPANAASGSKSLRATANGSTISEAAAVYCRPAGSYTLSYKIKTSGVTGEASVVVRFYGGTSPGSPITLSNTGTADYITRTRTFTTGPTAVKFTIEPRLTGTSGTAWWDDVEIVDSATGRPVLYNGGFESPPFGDDEFEWAVYHTMRSRERYEGGPDGTSKPWGSGEFGLMGADYDLSYWARYDDTTKPRHDSTGIHLHNCLWAQLMASAALNTPTYWWVESYVLAHNLHSAWKGATSFAGALPFYNRREAVSTDTCAADVLASSSDARIRLLGQKDSTSGYFWIQNKENTWSRVVREGLAPTPTSASLSITGFESGSYTANWYDTYTGSLVRTESANAVGGALQLSVSSLSTDTAVVVQKIQAQPQLSLVLTVDKTTAVPSEVITYTLDYTNEGDGEAVNVELTLPIPANTTFVSGSVSDGGVYDPAANCVRWAVPTLGPGASGRCVAKVKVN